MGKRRNNRKESEKGRGKEGRGKECKTHSWPINAGLNRICMRVANCPLLLKKNDPIRGVKIPVEEFFSIQQNIHLYTRYTIDKLALIRTIYVCNQSIWSQCAK
jgi:hypothetical protein